MLPFLYVVAGVALLIASITDLKTREVPDWLNYGLIFFAVMSRLIYSLVSGNYFFLAFGLAGLGFCLIISLAMYYAGQWGGGDSKLLMGLGALFGFDWTGFPGTLPFLANFLVNILVAGAVYGIIWGLALAFKNRRKFGHLFAAYSAKYAAVKRIALLAAILCIAASFFFQQFVQILLLALSVLIIMSLYLVILAKAIEKACMYKRVAPEKLTEGDWIAKDIIIDKKHIAGPKDLGISLQQIRTLVTLKQKKKISTVLIKEGIPFVPSFLLGYILTLSFGNVFLHLLGL